MTRPRAWDPPYQDDREEVLMIDSGQDPGETREALVMARRALSLLHQGDSKTYNKYAGPLQKLIDQLPAARKTSADYDREQREKAEAREYAAKQAREEFERIRRASGMRNNGSRSSYYDGR